MNRGWLAVATLVLIAPSVVAGGQSAAADRNGSWFKAEPAIRMARLRALTDADLDRWVVAARKSDPGASRQIGLVLMRFDPLFDAKNQPVKGAVAKYSERLAQLSTAIVEQWRPSGVDFMFAAIGLTAEDAFFPSEKFDVSAFRQFLAKFK